MKLNKCKVQTGVTFNVLEFEDPDIIKLVTEDGKASRITDAVNADRRQKVALVDARSFLSALIGEGDEDWKITGLGFKRAVVETVKRGDEDVDVYETENTHIERFVDALVDGSFVPSGHTITGEGDARRTSAIAYLQTLANQCGDKEHDGQKCFVLNLDQAVRKPGAGLIPKGALESAENIFKAGKERLEHWHNQFTNGYTSAKGIKIDPIAHESFLEKAAKGATPEQKEAHHQAMVRRLGKCIHAARQQERQKTEVALKEEFC